MYFDASFKSFYVEESFYFNQIFFQLTFQVLRGIEFDFTSKEFLKINFYLSIIQETAEVNQVSLKG